MDDPLVVGRAEGVADLREDVDHPPHAKRPAFGDLRRQVPSFEELEGHEEPPFPILPELDHVDDVGVADGVGGHRLPSEPRCDLLLFHEVRVEPLDRDLAASVDALGGVHRAHPTFTYNGLQSITARQQFGVVHRTRLRAQPHGRHSMTQRAVRNGCAM